MQSNRTSQQVDIVALIDEQLAAGQPEMGRIAACRYCGHEWHGLPCATRYVTCGCQGSHQDKPPSFSASGRKLSAPERAYAAIDSCWRMLQEIGIFG